MAEKEPPSFIIRIGGIIGTVMLLISGPMSGYFMLKGLREARESVHWPTTTGVITRSVVIEQAYYNKVSDYQIGITYSYIAGNMNWQAFRISSNDFKYSSQKSAEDALQNYPLGKQVTVYYSSADPSVAMLEPGAGVIDYLLLIVPVGMFTAGILMIRLLWRTWPRKQIIYKGAFPVITNKE